MDMRCECCELPEYSCGKAAAKKQEAEARQQSVELAARGWFVASYPGSCRGCGEDFEVGSLIHGTSDRYGHKGRKYFAECCAEALESQR